MARPASFNFIQEKHLIDDKRMSKFAGHTVSINAKHGYMHFSMSYVRDKNIENAFVKLYADTSKKAIGWKIMREKELCELDGYRRVKVTKSITKGHETSFCQLGIRKLLATLGVKEKSFKQLPIQSYQLSQFDGKIDYVELN